MDKKIRVKIIGSGLVEKRARRQCNEETWNKISNSTYNEVYKTIWNLIWFETERKLWSKIHEF